MHENPYETPKMSEAPGSGAGSPLIVNSTLEIARAQSGMMWLLLAKFGMDFVANMALELLSGPLWWLFLCAFLVVGIAIASFVFRLANAIYGVGPAIVCTLLAIVPCLGTLTVVVLNGSTMDRLRKEGVKVGFMGATKSQLVELAARRNAA